MLKHLETQQDYKTKKQKLEFSKLLLLLKNYQNI